MSDTALFYTVVFLGGLLVGYVLMGVALLFWPSRGRRDR